MAVDLPPEAVAESTTAAMPAARVTTGLRRLTLDVAPLREVPELRRLWAGTSLSNLGTQLTAVAVPVQVYALTHSSFAVGLVGLVAVVPLVVFGLVGGAVADAVDRRRLALVTSTGLALCSLGLLAQAALHADRLWLLYLLVGLQAGLFAVDSPTRRTFEPRLVRLDQLPAVAALDQIGFNLGTTGGPLLAGLLIASSGVQAAYLLDAVSYVAALYALARLRPMPPEGGGRRAGAASVLEGLRFLRTRRVLLASFLVDLDAMIFGMPRALFPALAVGHFHGGARTVGLLYAGPAVGALLGALLSGPLGRVRRQGLGVIVAIAGWGAAVTAFGLTDILWVALVCLAAAGAADMVSAVFRTAITQAATPDALRGRLSGVFIVVVAGGPRVGDLESGSVAALSSPVVAAVSGGLACLVGLAALVVLLPSLARYDARHPSEEQPEKVVASGREDPLPSPLTGVGRRRRGAGHRQEDPS